MVDTIIIVILFLFIFSNIAQFIFKSSVTHNSLVTSMDVHLPAPTLKYSVVGTVCTRLLGVWLVYP